MSRTAIEPHARLKRSESRAQTRARLLAEARAAFLRFSYARTSLDQVAERAGFSKGAFYSNFVSKEEIFVLLLEEKLRGDAAALGTALMPQDDYDIALKTLHGYLSGRPDLLAFTGVAVEFLSQLPPRSPAGLRCAALYAEQRAAIAALVAHFALLCKCQTSPDADAAAAGFVALALGLATQSRLDPEAISGPLWADLSVAFLDRLLRSG